MSMVQDVRVVRKFQMGKLEGGGGRDFSQAKSDKAVIEYESQSIGLTKVSPGNVREYLPVFGHTRPVAQRDAFNDRLSLLWAIPAVDR